MLLVRIFLQETYTRRGVVIVHFCPESQHLGWYKYNLHCIYNALTSATWQAAPCQIWSVTKPQKYCLPPELPFCQTYLAKTTQPFLIRAFEWHQWSWSQQLSFSYKFAMKLASLEYPLCIIQSGNCHTHLH